MSKKCERCGRTGYHLKWCQHWRAPLLSNIKSIDEIIEFLKVQGDLRAPENDEGGILHDLALELALRVAELEIP